MSWPLFAIGAALAIIVRDLAHKKALRHEHALEMLVARSLFLVPLLILLAFLVPIRLPLTSLAAIYGVSLVATTAILLRNKGLRHLDVGVAGPLQNVSPLFLLLIAGLALGERPGPVQLGGVLLIVAGTYVLERSSEYRGLLGPLKHLWQDRLAWLPILAALVFSVSQTLDKHLLGGVAPLTYFVWIWLFINLNFLLLHLVRFRWRGLRLDVVRDWHWLAVAAVALFLQMLAYYTAASQGPITLVVPIMRLGSLGLVFLGGRLFHEEGIGRKATATGLMVAGATMILV